MTGIEALLVGIVTSLLFLVPAGVILLRPVSKRLGDYLEAAAAAKRGASGGELTAIRSALERLEARVAVTEERLEARLSLTEERLDFQEKLLSDRPSTDSAAIERSRHS
jgi:hypothetical protein